MTSYQILLFNPSLYQTADIWCNYANFSTIPYTTSWWNSAKTGEFANRQWTEIAENAVQVSGIPTFSQQLYWGLLTPPPPPPPARLPHSAILRPIKDSTLKKHALKKCNYFLPSNWKRILFQASCEDLGIFFLYSWGITINDDDYDAFAKDSNPSCKRWRCPGAHFIEFVIHWQIKWHSWFWLAMKHCHWLLPW